LVNYPEVNYTGPRHVEVVHGKMGLTESQKRKRFKILNSVNEKLGPRLLLLNSLILMVLASDFFTANLTTGRYKVQTYHQVRSGMMCVANVYIQDRTQFKLHEKNNGILQVHEQIRPMQHPLFGFSSVSECPFSTLYRSKINISTVSMAA
jgi:Holliday junction resolvasome RuvABC DNA-binding subunit